MNPNLTSTANFSYKDILLRKVYHAVASSVIAQLVILVVYIFIANIKLLHPIEWMTSALNTFTYISTWIFFVIFLGIIFAQCLICAKDYVLMYSYRSTRFQQFLHILSAHNFMLLLLHVSIGGVLVWQILSIVDGEYKDLIIRKEKQYCLVADTLYLIFAGFWTGLVYFIRVYITSKHLVFPVIQQKKFFHFRSNIAPLFKESVTLSFWPMITFAVFYYFWGNHLETRFLYLFNLREVVSHGNILVYFYSWWFSALYFFSMNLMRFFFYLYLTESVEFPLVKSSPNVLTLQDGIAMTNLPIIQNLACLDLFLLAQWSPARRQVFFTLSQPGGHPHNWNALVETVLKLFSEYTDLLKKSAEVSLPQKNFQKPSEVVSSLTSPIGLQSPGSYNMKFRNLRNMSLCNDHLDIVDVSHNLSSVTILESAKSVAGEKIHKLLGIAKIVFGINYFFGELPEVNIQKCLGNGHLIIWASQGIAELMTASLVEDQYGIVQKDLPVIVTSLVQLKQNLDSLSKVPALSRKVASLDDFNYKMKNAVSAAVKRSLFNICLNFGGYFSEFSLSKEVVQYLQTNIMLKNCH